MSHRPEAGPAPQLPIDLQCPANVQAWCQYFACSETELHQAVYAVGTGPTQLHVYFTAQFGIAWDRLLAA